MHLTQKKFLSFRDQLPILKHSVIEVLQKIYF